MESHAHRDHHWKQRFSNMVIFILKYLAGHLCSSTTWPLLLQLILALINWHKGALRDGRQQDRTLFRHQTGHHSSVFACRSEGINMDIEHRDTYTLQLRKNITRFTVSTRPAVLFFIFQTKSSRFSVKRNRTNISVIEGCRKPSRLLSGSKLTRF
jgi:hypothetical protein